MKRITLEAQGKEGLPEDDRTESQRFHDALQFACASRPPQDLYAYLDERVLRRLWALLRLPAQLRRAWEQRFPVLAEISRSPASARPFRLGRAVLGPVSALLTPALVLAGW